MVFTISDSKYADELIELDFPKGLMTTAENCKLFFKHCKTNKMKFLEGSYGSLVHQDYDKYFKLCPKSSDNTIKIIEKIAGFDGFGSNSKYNLPLDHTNLFQSKDYNDVYILTSSPYGTLSYSILDVFKEYPYGVYVINPNFVDYHGFIGRFGNKIRNPLWDLNFAFTNASIKQILDISEKIFEGSEIFNTFDPLIDSMWCY